MAFEAGRRRRRRRRERRGAAAAMADPTKDASAVQLTGQLSIGPFALVRGFYIFNVITDDTYQNIIFTMTPTNLSFLSCASYIYTIFAYVVRHGGLTRWCTVSNACEMS